MNQNPNKPPSPSRFHAIELADKRTMRQFDTLCTQQIELSEAI